MPQHELDASEMVALIQPADSRAEIVKQPAGTVAAVTSAAVPQPKISDTVPQ
jgi:hypothetical protein